MDLCIEAFGTSKQKRALNSRRMNAVGNDVVNTAVTKAAANVIEAKGVTGKNTVWGVNEGNQKYFFLSVPCQMWWEEERSFLGVTKEAAGLAAETGTRGRTCRSFWWKRSCFL